jgi:hypothetical protein
MAKAFTKQVTASPAVSARAAPQSAKTILTALEDKAAERRIDCSVSHSLTKPLNGGRAAIESAPTRQKAPVQGILRRSPPRRSRSRVPVAASIEPLPMNKSAL